MPFKSLTSRVNAALATIIHAVRAMSSDDERKRAAGELFAALAGGSMAFADVVATRFAEWRALFSYLKEFKDDERSAFSVVASSSGVCEFDTWGRERQPMFGDEFGKLLKHAGVVEAIGEDFGVRASARAVEASPARRDTEASFQSVENVEHAFRKIQTPSRVAHEPMAIEVNVVQEKQSRGLGAATRVERAAEPPPPPPPPRAKAQMVQNSPPPTPRPAQLSPPPNEYERYTPETRDATMQGASAPAGTDDAHVEHLMSYLTGFHGLLFGLKDHVERIRSATIENVAHELARTDARLDTAIARLEAAMGVESGGA